MGTIEQYCRYLRNQANLITNSSTELVDLAIEWCYILKPNSGKDFVWKVFGDELIENLIKNKAKKIFIPVQNDNGSIRYLGNNYELKEVDIQVD